MQALTEILMRRTATANLPPPRMRRRFRASLPIEDADDLLLEGLYDSRDDVLVAIAMAIDYVDAEGQESRRRVTVHRVQEQPNDLLLACYCHERRAPRHFKGSQIRAIFDPDTGQMVDERSAIAEHLSALRSLLPGSVAFAGNEPAAAVRAAINVLLFLARCDGHEHPEETTVLLDFMDYHAAPPGLDTTAAEALLRRLHPDPILFENSLALLERKSPSMLTMVARSARRLVDADGRIVPEEVEFGRLLDAALARIRD